jgi:hypothetical protein
MESVVSRSDEKFGIGDGTSTFEFKKFKLPKLRNSQPVVNWDYVLSHPEFGRGIVGSMVFCKFDDSDGNAKNGRCLNKDEDHGFMDCYCGDYEGKGPGVLISVCGTCKHWDSTDFCDCGGDQGRKR